MRARNPEPGARSRLRRALLYLIFFLFAAALVAEEPGLEIDADGQLVLHNLPRVLDHDEVGPHLTRGLTTTFLLRVEPKGAWWRRKEPAGARIEIRYELWDEVFEVAAGTTSGQIVRHKVTSLGELESWWQSLRLVVATSGLDPPPEEARVSLDVVPFSRAEQQDTQRWFSESLDDAASSAPEGVAESADKPAKTLDRTLHLLMATSIQRPALVSFRWNVPITAPGGAS